MQNENTVVIPDTSEDFRSYVEGIGTHEDFGNRVGYCRQTISAFCNGKEDIPKVLIRLMEMAEKLGKEKTDNSALRRENERLRRKK